MSKVQAPDPALTGTRLLTERLGPLPLVNEFLARLDLDARLSRFVPSSTRVKLPYAVALGALLRSLLVEREPVYRQAEVVASFAPSAFGLSNAQAASFTDDALGRALDQLFDADRAGLITDVIVAAANEFGVRMDELHNDSTTIKFTGHYQQAAGREVRGKRTPLITRGFSKDHRPDLKQLLFILTTSSDGGVPVQFRVGNGNENDSGTHIDTWNSLRNLTSSTDFLYVADSKLCSREAMNHIHKAGGKFVTVMPRSRLEDQEFRAWVITNQPDWELVSDAPHPRQPDGPRDRVYVQRAKLPSSEGWPVTWIFSNLLALKQEHRRRERIAKAAQALEELAAKLTGPKPRLKTKADIHARIDNILVGNQVKQYLTVKLDSVELHAFKQTKRGRPGPKTKYQRTTKKAWHLTWTVNDDAIRDAHASDGMYPLLSNDTTLTPQQVLAAHKRQPVIEKRFKDTKDHLEIAPVLLKNEARIEALFLIYFLALLVSTLIERELRHAMRDQHIHSLPLYPEERTTTRPTSEQILKLYAHTQRHAIIKEDRVLHAYQPELTDLQQQILTLLKVPITRYQPADD
jgi:transposase